MSEPMEIGEAQERAAGAFMQRTADLMEHSTTGQLCIVAREEFMSFFRLAARVLDPPPDDPKFIAKVHAWTQRINAEIRNSALEEAARLTLDSTDFADFNVAIVHPTDDPEDRRRWQLRQRLAEFIAFKIRELKTKP